MGEALQSTRSENLQIGQSSSETESSKSCNRIEKKGHVGYSNVLARDIDDSDC